MGQTANTMGRLCAIITLLMAIASGHQARVEKRDSDHHSSNCIVTQFRKVAYDSFLRVDADRLKDARPPASEEHGPVSIRENSLHVRTITGNQAASQPQTRNMTARSNRLGLENGPAIFERLRRTDLQRTAHRELTDFTLTAYSVSPHSTGKQPNSVGYGITYSGTHATVDRTVAVDPRVIPIGTPIYIDGIGWRLAEDTGGAVKGRHIDLLLESDGKAIQFGVRRHVRVFVLPNNIDLRGFTGVNQSANTSARTLRMGETARQNSSPPA